MSWFSKWRKPTADDMVRDELLEVLMQYVPSGMTPAEQVRRTVRVDLNQIDAVTARKTQQMVVEHWSRHNGVSLLVWDALARRNPNSSLPRIADNFSYIESIGWKYAGAMIGLVLRSFPDEPLTLDLDTSQERALLRLEDSKWHTDYTPHGGTKSKHRNDYHPCVLEAAVKHPLEIERIIDIALSRQPESLEHIEEMLASEAPIPLRDGEL